MNIAAETNYGILEGNWGNNCTKKTLFLSKDLLPIYPSAKRVKFYLHFYFNFSNIVKIELESLDKNEKSIIIEKKIIQHYWNLFKSGNVDTEKKRLEIVDGDCAMQKIKSYLVECLRFID